MADQNDHDLLICINQKIDSLQNEFRNHLRHHWDVKIAAVYAGLIGMINFGIAMIIIFFRN